MGFNCFLRNFVVSPLADSNGNPIGGFLGTLRSIKWMIREIRASRVFFVWDGQGGAQRRRGVVADYKMGRKPRLNREVEEKTGDSKQNMAWQKERLKASLGFLGITQIEVENIEADDTIGYLVGLLDPTPKVVVSSDRDMWQLVSSTTSVYWPTKKVFITPGNFREYSRVLSYNFVLARAMSGKGDASDNIRGIRGLGEKTIEKVFGPLLELPCTVAQLAEQVSHHLKLQEEGKLKLTASQIRWFRAFIADLDLVSRNVQVMQLTEPSISPQAANIIKSAVDAGPKFNVTGFKVALINNGVQLTDQDFFSTFQEYRLRATNEAH